MQRIILFFLIIILFGCNEKNKGGWISINYLTEYQNEYDADSLLISTLVTGYLIDGGQKYRDRSEHLVYTYEDGILTCKEELWNEGPKSLRFITNYRPGIEEQIHMEEDDTVSYHFYQYDREGRKIYEIKKQYLSYPHYGIHIDDDFEEWSTYNLKGELVKKVLLNNYNGERVETHYFNDELPSDLPDENVINVHYITEQSGDTSVIKRYSNGELEDIYKSLKMGSSTYEWVYNKENELISADQTIVKGEEEIFITYSPEVDGLDSLYYKNNRLIRSVFIEPEHRSVEVIRYDQAGNKLLEEKSLSFLP